MDTTGLWLFLAADKVVIALLLALAAFIFDGILEKRKAGLAFKNEIAKQRVIHISETWSVLYQFEAASEKLLREVSEVIIRHGNDRDAKITALRKLAPLEKESRKKGIEVQNFSDANRFWLGETLYARIRTYHHLLMEKVNAFAKADSNSLNKLKSSQEKIDEARKSILDYVENPL